MSAYPPPPKPPRPPKKLDFVAIVGLGIAVVSLAAMGAIFGGVCGVIFSTLITGDFEKGPAWPFVPCVIAGVVCGLVVWWQVVKIYR